MRWQKLYNPFVIWTPRSPLHGLMSNFTMLITFTGRKSGRPYTTPVNYVRDDDTILSMSPRKHSWWKNLRGEHGAPVTPRVRGGYLTGTGHVFEGDATINEGGLPTLLQGSSAFAGTGAWYLTPDGEPGDPAGLSRVARDNALIRTGDLSPDR